MPKKPTLDDLLQESQKWGGAPAPTAKPTSRFDQELEGILNTPPAKKRSVVTGAISTTFGPLFRSLAEGAAVAGSPGQVTYEMRTGKPARTAAEKVKETEQSIAESEQQFRTEYPKTALTLGIGGAIGRYAAVPFTKTFGAIEAAASKPEESVAELAAQIAERLGFDRTSKVARRLSQSLLGRVATDVAFGGLVETPFRLLKAGKAGRAAQAEASAAERLAAEEAAYKAESWRQFGEGVEESAKETRAANERLRRIFAGVPEEAAPAEAKAVAEAIPERVAPDLWRSSRWANVPGARAGFISPELLLGTAKIGGRALLGGATGGVAGETPEEKKRLALLGALAFAGAPELLRASEGALSRNEAIGDVLSSIRRAERKPGPGPAPARIVNEVIEATSAQGKRLPTPTGVQPARSVELTEKAQEILPKNRQNVLRRLGLSPELQDTYAQRVADISSGMEPMTWEETAAQASKLLNSQRELLGKVAPEKMTGAEGLAIASIIRENVEKVVQLSKSLTTEIDDTAREAIKKQIADIEGNNGVLLGTLVQGTSAQGRALNASKILANLTSDPTYWLLKGSRVKGSEALTIAEQQTITNLLNQGNKEKLIQYLAGLRKTGGLEQITQLRRAGLLTAIPGRLRDLVSTGINIITETALRAPEALADVVASNVASAKTGLTPSALRSVAAPTVEGIRAMAMGAKEGLNEAMQMVGAEAIKKGDFKNWAEFIRAAQIDPAILKRYDVPQQITIDFLGDNKASAILDTYQKFAMRMSGFTDKLFRASAYRGAMVEQANLEAIREGLTGSAAKQRAAELLEKPTEAMIANATEAAEMLTFTNDGTLAKTISSMIEAGARGAGPRWGKYVRAGAALLTPFRLTPANVLTRVAEYSPGIGWGIAYKRSRDWLKEVGLMALETQKGTTVASKSLLDSQRKMVESLVRTGTGSLGIIGLGFYLYDRGVLTGEAPTSEREQEQWRLEGKTPNSILVNGKWYPVGNIAPTGNMLAIAANMKQQAQEGTLLERTAASGIDVMRTMLDVPMLTGPREALEAISGRKDTNRERYLQNLLGSFVPAGLSQVSRIEGTQKLPQTLGESVLSRIPGLNKGIPERLNVFGEPVQKPSGLLNVAVSPLPASEDIRQRDPLVAEMSSVGVELGPLSRGKDQRGTQESLESYQNRQRLAGTALRQGLERLIASPGYQKASPERKKERIEQQAERIRKRFSYTYNKRVRQKWQAAPEE